MALGWPFGRSGSVVFCAAHNIQMWNTSDKQTNIFLY
jgi:hypothetical protein